MRIFFLTVILLVLNACATSSGPVALLDPLKVKYRVSQTFGPNKSPITGKPSFHYGLDMAAQRGSSVRAAANGVVTRASVASGYGNLVEIDHGGGVKTRYAHLDIFRVRKGQKVLTGQSVGTLGLTGRTTGPHLHFEVLQNGRQIDPYRCIILGRRNNLSVSPQLQNRAVEELVKGVSGL